MNKVAKASKEEMRIDIKGFEGLYMISNLGNIKSLSRKTDYIGGYTHKNGGLVLSKAKSSIGYYKVVLHKGNIKYYKLVHRLISEAFIPNINNLPRVNHKDGNKSNNSIDNLERCDASYNQKHSYDVLGRKKSRAWLGKQGQNNPFSKVIYQYDLVGNLLGTRHGGYEIQRKLGFNQSCISSCCLGKRKTSYNFIWKYK